MVDLDIKAAQRLSDSIFKNSLSGLIEMAREDYALLKRLSEKHHGKEDFALLQAHGAFALAIVSDWDIAGAYIEDMDNLLQMHPTSIRIKEKYIHVLQCFLATVEMLAKDSVSEETATTIRGEIKRIETGYNIAK